MTGRCILVNSPIVNPSLDKKKNEMELFRSREHPDCDSVSWSHDLMAVIVDYYALACFLKKVDAIKCV